MESSIVSIASSAAVAILIASLTAFERFYQQRQQIMLRALEYLTGGSQKRSVGVALIEGLSYKRHPYWRAILPALMNQAVYLLLATRSKASHQSQNFARIMILILRVPYKSEFQHYFIELIEALRTRSEHTMMDTGIEMPSPMAKYWIKKLADHSHIENAI